MASVQLRDLPIWPPVWTRQDARVEKTAIDSYLRGEIGILRDARPDLSASAITLTIEHDGHTWVGLLPVDATAETLLAIVALLQEHRCQPIRHVAALAVPS